ncbi:unnamed protein product [Paramecium octaurelia]|uniref:Uncharacterized protein n=1 Tax=Paramecium octaurelia TaxID=43137 RepID=A0A8S1THQ3_PAROT|nr:unnamed protein product [Paramecium octaurelia]
MPILSNFLISKTQDQILALLQTGSDAIDTVFGLLNDLKQSNIDAQFAADQKNETDEWVRAQQLNNSLKSKP